MFENSRIKTVVIVLAVALTAAAVVSTAPTLFMIVPTEHTQNSNSVQTASMQIKGPPPRPLTMWGAQDSFDHAKSTTGLSWVSLPTQILPNTNLQSVRVRDDPGMKLVTAIYASSGITAADSDTFEKVMNGGGVFIIYSSQSAPKFNLTSALETMAKEFPDKHLDTIKGHQALVSSNEIYINLGNNNMVDIVSWTRNSNELRTIADSIAM